MNRFSPFTKLSKVIMFTLSSSVISDLHEVPTWVNVVVTECSTGNRGIWPLIRKSEVFFLDLDNRPIVHRHYPRNKMMSVSVRSLIKNAIPGMWLGLAIPRIPIPNLGQLPLGLPHFESTGAAAN